MVSEAEHLEVKNALATCKDNAAYYESVFNCISYMHIGDYTKAEPYCDMAGAINPDDEKYERLRQMFEQERADFTEALMQ